MPVLIVKAKVNSANSSDPAFWQAGYMPNAVNDDHEFGWLEMPKQFQGDATVAQVNAASPQQFHAYRLTDAGTITNGGSTFDVVPGDCLVWQLGRFINYGQKTEFDTKNYLVYVTDKTLDEVNAYLQEWNHNPTTIQISNQGNTRLLEVTSDMVSATGKNAFTQAGVQSLLDSINADYPTANASYDSHTASSFRIYVTVPQANRDELIARINSAVREMQYSRRRWYITAAGMSYLSTHDGIVAGTAAQVAGYLRDGLLD